MRKIISGVVTLAVFCWACVFIFGFISAFIEDGKDYPGKKEFKAANENINVYSKETVFGDSPESLQVATAFSTQLKEMCDAMFTVGSKFTAASGGHFLTYVSITPERVVILCHVPDLRGYQDEARDALAKIAWLAAQAAVKDQKVSPNTTLVVGLRGFASYGPILEGKYAGPVDRTSDGLSDLNRIYPYFVAAAPAK